MKNKNNKRKVFSFFNIQSEPEKINSYNNRWQLINVNLSEKEILAKAEEFELDPILIKLLASQNVSLKNKEELHDFISPKKAKITDFSSITSKEELQKSLQRIKEAIKSKEKIMINGDPDADGIAGTTVLAAGLSFLGANICYDFPTRSKEGHGLQTRIIDYCKRKNIALILTTDCGTKDVEAVDYAKALGIDVIINDHHVLGNNLPSAYAMINPYLAGKGVEDAKLSGSLVAFKFVIAAAHYLKRSLPIKLKDFLLAVGSLGALSDRVSLKTPLNRIMIKEGIKALNETEMEGLKALKKSSSINESMIKPREASRTIIPKLNAPGRIGDKDEDIPDSNVVVDLLLLGTGEKNEKKALKIIDLLKNSLSKKKQATSKHFEDLEDKILAINAISEKRRKITSKIEDEIEALIQALSHQQQKVIIIKGKNWNPGVIGIDADRIRERYLKPVIIFTSISDSAYLRGSVRSIPSLNMYEILNNISDEFEKKNKDKLFCVEVKTSDGATIVNSFGGHPQACGFSVHKENYNMLVEKIHAALEKVPKENLQYSYNILHELTFDDIRPTLVKKFDKASPYGQGFDLPIFMMKNCTLSKKFRPFGSRYQKTQTPHIEFKIIYPNSKDDKNARRLKAVGFGLWHKFEEIVLPNKKAFFDIIFTLDTYKATRRKNNKGRRERVEINVLDIRPS
ncbi:DHH family phosphoesterase [Candidatus Margulisiibacteriota bacterium]